MRQKSARHERGNPVKSRRIIVFPGNVAWIQNIKIVKEYRRQGFGTATINEIIDYLKLQGIQRIELNVFGHNENAIRLYNKLGFKIKNLTLGIEI